jgi:hypothetical protein
MKLRQLADTEADNRDLSGDQQRHFRGVCKLQLTKVKSDCLLALKGQGPLGEFITKAFLVRAAQQARA